MSEGQSLLLLFVALYFIECLRWLPGQTYLILGSGRRWYWQRPFQALKLLGSCPALLSFLPPLRAHFTALPWQIVPAAEDLEFHGEAHRPQLLPWADLNVAVESRVLHLNHAHRIRFLSENDALLAQQQIQRWLKQTPTEREADFLSYAEQTLQTELVTDSADKITDQTRLLRSLGSLIFIWAFVVIVSLYRWFGDAEPVLWAGGFLIALQFTQAFFFYRRSQNLSYRIWKAVAIALLPQHAMRAADLLSDAHGASPSHPLAARALIGDGAWKKLAGQFWKQARYSTGRTAELQSRALEAFFAKQGVMVSELETVPPQQPGSASYCPSCQAQFQSGVSLCQDCRGVMLRAF